MTRIKGILHFHAASIGETKCAYKVIQRLSENGEFLKDKHLLLTYTSDYAYMFFKKANINIDIDIKKLSDIKIAEYLNSIGVNESTKNILIILEKDRRTCLIDVYEKIGTIINIEAKPPQSTKSIRYEKYIAKSLNKINLYMCENQQYSSDILKYNNKANILITGTLKMPDIEAEAKTLLGPRNIVYISVRVHEIPVLANIINNLKSIDIPLRHIVIPRYVKSDMLPSKNYKIFSSVINRYIKNINIVSSNEDLLLNMEKHDVGVFMYNAIGDVETILKNMHVAVVCGSLCDFGMFRSKGHNVYEPLAYNIPTIIGPKYQNWKYAVQNLLDDGLIIECKPNEIAEEVSKLVRSPTEYNQLSTSISESPILKGHKNACAKIVEQIVKICNEL